MVCIDLNVVVAIGAWCAAAPDVGAAGEVEAGSGS